MKTNLIFLNLHGKHKKQQVMSVKTKVWSCLLNINKSINFPKKLYQAQIYER